MNNDQRQADAATRALLEEAYRHVRRVSSFWSVDHPSDAILDSGPRLDVSRGFPAQQSDADNLAGAQVSLRGAERMRDAADTKMRDLERVAERAIGDAREELRPMVWAAVNGTLKGDLHRARAEVRHRKDQVLYWQGRVGVPARTPLRALPAEPDRRLPREREIGDDDDEPTTERTT